jgi:hypothetical protein
MLPAKIQEWAHEIEGYGVELNFTVADAWLTAKEWRVTGNLGGVKLLGAAQFWGNINSSSLRIWTEADGRGGTLLFVGHDGPNVQVLEHRWLDIAEGR